MRLTSEFPYIDIVNVMKSKEIKVKSIHLSDGKTANGIKDVDENIALTDQSSGIISKDREKISLERLY